VSVQILDKRKAPLFYAVECVADGFLICRNAAALCTPANARFVVPTKALADCIADEWRAQGDKLKPETMPLTQLAATTLDIIGKKADQTIASLAAYAESDLLSHRADQPPELVERQTNLWQPWLAWAERRYGAVLAVGQGVMPVAQPAASLSALRSAVEAYDVFHLAGLQQAVGVSGSLVLGLALAEKAATVDELFAAAELDSLFQIEQWGEDPVTLDRHASVKREFELAQKWFRLLSPEA
jgi:chaperone required for assembly of F1-ATPase